MQRIHFHILIQNREESQIISCFIFICCCHWTGFDLPGLDRKPNLILDCGRPAGSPVAPAHRRSWNAVMSRLNTPMLPHIQNESRPDVNNSSAQKHGGGGKGWELREAPPLSSFHMLVQQSNLGCCTAARAKKKPQKEQEASHQRQPDVRRRSIVSQSRRSAPAIPAAM